MVLVLMFLKKFFSRIPKAFETEELSIRPSDHTYSKLSSLQDDCRDSCSNIQTPKENELIATSVVYVQG